MNKLFIIGNGFDLAHGLKTSYSDFIVWYLNSVVNKCKNNNRVYEDKMIRVQFGSILNLEKSSIIRKDDFHTTMHSYYGNIEYKNKLVSEILKKNSVDKNWVDFEILYYQLLKDELKNLGDHSNAVINRVVTAVEKINDCFEFLKQKLIEYLSTIEINNTLIQTTISDKIYSEINNSIEKNAKNRVWIEKNLNNGNHPSQEIMNRHKMEYICYLNFNYTNALMTKYDPKSYNEEFDIDIIDIHGTMQDISTPERIIFGYGDEIDEHYKTIENLNENEFLKNIKSFGYFHSDNYKKLLTFIEADEFEVHLMGHSCGLSDRVLLNTVFEHDNCKNIKIYYHKRTDGTNNYTELTMNISRHFKDKTKMRERIAPITECKPLVG